jgi:hypothetical protein
MHPVEPKLVPLTLVGPSADLIWADLVQGARPGVSILYDGESIVY